MSYQAADWASHRAPMLLTDAGRNDTTARAVLKELAEHANEYGGNSFPSNAHIQWSTGYDERTVQRALRRLEETRLIRVTGISRDGCTVYQLNLDMTRPDSDWEEIVAAIECRREADVARQSKRRSALKSSDVSRTQSAGQIDSEPVDNPAVTHSASGRHALSVRTSRTSTADVTHSVPPEPSRNHQENHQGTVTGGAPPPDPRRHEPPSGSRSEPPSEISNGADVQPQSDTATTDRTREANSGCSNPQCAKGYILIQAPPYFEACDICQPNVIPFREKRTA